MQWMGVKRASADAYRGGWADKPNSEAVGDERCSTRSERAPPSRSREKQTHKGTPQKLISRRVPARLFLFSSQLKLRASFRLLHTLPLQHSEQLEQPSPFSMSDHGKGSVTVEDASDYSDDDHSSHSGKQQQQQPNGQPATSSSAASDGDRSALQPAEEGAVFAAAT
jgi:hypothetical protein